MKKLSKGYTWLPDKQLYKLRFTIQGSRYTVYGKTQKECEEKKDEKKELLENHMNIDNQKITLNRYYNNVWLEEQKKVVKPSSLYSYEKSWRYINDFIGEKKIVDLVKADIIQFQKKLNADRSVDTVNRSMKLLKQVLTCAVNDRIISFNPCNGVKNLKNEKPKAADTNHRALSVEETTLFLSNATDSWYYLLFKFLLNTGLRIGEALALTWFDVKVEKKEIIVNKTVSRTSNKGFELSNTPKTSSSIRTIPITDTIEAILKDQRQNCQFLFARSILIFPNAKGELSNYNSVNACIKHIIKNIPDGMNDPELFTEL